MHFQGIQGNPMTIRIWKKLILVLTITLSQTTLAAAGNFFDITGSGAPATLDIVLCLNGNGPLTCQNYTVTRQTLSIRTITPNHLYPAAGIKLKTPGYTLANTNSGCTPIANDFCLFSVSNTSPKTIQVSAITTDTTLSASVATLALSVKNTATNAALTGHPRTITITNRGIYAASNVTYTLSPALPVGTIITPATCGTIASLSSCILTISPGATASATPGDITPTAITLTIKGDNTNTLNPTLNILTYGSVYQSGYIFSIDDSTPKTASIGGKVAALVDQAPTFPDGIMWGEENVVVGGISQVDTAGPNSCNGNSDGACNTGRIIANFTGQRGLALTTYAAGLCKAIISGYNDWYLPAICELGFQTALNRPTGCGLPPALPTMQNMQSNLFGNDIGALLGPYWGSTEHSPQPGDFAWDQIFALNSSQDFGDKEVQIGVRCARAIT